MQSALVDRDAMGVRIRELRQERGIKLDELATRVGISASHLSRLERGQTSPSFAVGAAIARELGVTANDLAIVNRTQGSVNRDLVTALLALGMDPEIAVEIQRSISTTARQELLDVLTNRSRACPAKSSDVPARDAHA